MPAALHPGGKPCRPLIEISCPSGNSCSSNAEELAARLRQRLAVLANKDSGATINVGRKRLSQDDGAFREGKAGPCRLSGLCGSDGLVHVRGRSAYDRSHELVRPGRIPDLDPLSAVDQLPVDQHVFGNRSFGVSRCLHWTLQDMFTFGGLQHGRAY